MHGRASGSTTRHFDPSAGMVGGYDSRDGTVEFYARVNTLLGPDSCVLDLGAGRGAWFAEDQNPVHRQLRDIRSKVAQFIGADVDDEVLSNPTTTSNVVIRDGVIPLGDATVDLIVSDFVLEHIDDVAAFCKEVDRILKPGGFFCGRTPHALNYVSVAARLISNSRHIGALRHLQPTRKPADVFPTRYRLNTRRRLKAMFASWTDYSYVYECEPMYYFGSKAVFDLMSYMQRLLPRAVSGTIFVFLQKPAAANGDVRCAQ